MQQTHKLLIIHLIVPPTDIIQSKISGALLAKQFYRIVCQSQIVLRYEVAGLVVGYVAMVVKSKHAMTYILLP